MKIVHLNNADISGGAAIAAFRIHKSLVKRELHSRMWVNNSNSGDWTVRGPDSKWKKAAKKVAAEENPEVAGNGVESLYNWLEIQKAITL